VTDLQRLVEALQTKVRDLNGLVFGEDADGTQELALEELGGDSVLEVIQTHQAAIDERDDRIDTLEEAVATLEDRVETLERLHRHDGTDAKVHAIVEYAANQAGSQQRGIVVTPKEIRGATGCSRRYAYDLVDELPEKYPFLISRDDARQYGELEMDHDAQSKGLVVVLDEDCEVVHSQGPSVNRFTTRYGREGGSA